MAGYIGNKSQTLVDGYTKAAADDEFVNDPNSVITVSGSNVGIGTDSPSGYSAGYKQVVINGGANPSMLQLNNTTTGEGANTGGLAIVQSGVDAYLINPQATGTTRFFTNNTERMRIDSVGNVGIGTASPTRKLAVADPSAAGSLQLSGLNGGYVEFTDGVASSQSYIGTPKSIIGSGSTQGLMLYAGLADSIIMHTNGSENMRLDSSGILTVNRSGAVSSLDGVFGVQIGDTVNNTSAGVALSCTSGEWLMYTNSDDSLIFYDAGANTEIARFTSSGRFYCTGGVTGYGATRADFLGTSNNFGATFRNGASSQAYASAFGSNTGELAYFYADHTLTGGPVGSITENGSSTAFNTTSDYRLKENVTDLTNAADRLAQIPVRRFNFIATPDMTVDGFLAHEVQAVVPEAIFGEKDAVDAEGNPVYQQIDQSKLVPLLTAALQEALDEIKDLKARVAVLEGGA